MRNTNNDNRKRKKNEKELDSKRIRRDRIGEKFRTHPNIVQKKTNQQIRVVTHQLASRNKKWLFIYRLKNLLSHITASPSAMPEISRSGVRDSHQTLEFMFDYRRGVVSFKCKLRIRKQITLAICINNLTIDRMSQGRFQQTFE